jgi:hypothetical protein
MGVPISIRLDDDVRVELEAQVRARGIGLATLLRDVATKAAQGHAASTGPNPPTDRFCLGLWHVDAFNSI